MATNTLRNRRFDDIAIGDSASLSRTLTEQDIQMFARASGDLNPTHLDAGFARRFAGSAPTGHSMWVGSLLSGLMGNELPGPGTVYLSQQLSFHNWMQVGDTATVTVRVREKRPEGRVVVLDCDCVNQRGERVMSGVAEVRAPDEAVEIARPELDACAVQTHSQFEALFARCRGLEPVATAVVHPCDASSLGGAVDAAAQGLIRPLLVGPEAKIRAIAAAEGLDLGGLCIVDAPHSHAAAAEAVALVRGGQAQMMMKGSLHTDELMAAVVRADTGLRTERRISHVFVLDVPTYPRLLLVTDAAINIAPDLLVKRDICQNAIDLAHVLGLPRPRVAILSAVETVNPKMASTLDAAALCKMADRGQITGALLDGPLALDNAISPEAAAVKKIESEVAGRADILLVPDLEAGNILAKQLTFLGNADAAGVVLGARVPIVLTSRADNRQAKLASCAVAALMARAGEGFKVPKV